MSINKLTTAWLNEATMEIFTPKLRMVYPVLLEPKINKKFPNNPPKFSSIGLVPKDASIDVLRDEVTKLSTSLYGSDWKAKAAEDPTFAVKLPIKKTANYDRLKEYAADFPWFINVSANQDYPPAVFGPDTKPLANRTAKEVYGGRWAIFAVNVWGPKPENKNVNRFVSIGLKRAQLLDHDDVIATGQVTTADGFEGVDVGSAPASNGSSDDLFA